MAAMRNLLRSCAAALALLSTAAHAFSSDDSYGPTSYGVNDCGKETLHTHRSVGEGSDALLKRQADIRSALHTADHRSGRIREGRGV